jgi:polysaccharide deacetylase 2 family uncharacterized protein YibQ
VPKRKRRASASTRGPWLLALVLAAAALLAYALLRPVNTSHRHHAASVAPATAQARAVLAPTPTAFPSKAPSAAPTQTAAAETAAPGRAKLAIIIDDCGQWIDTERAFADLPIPLTLSVLPDVRYTATIARYAAAHGKGVMLHLPMETVSGLNPGPGKVTTEMSDAAIRAQVDGDLAQIPLAQGVNNHEGSKATADARVMRDVAQAMARHGDLFFIDSRTVAASVAQREVAAAGLPTASRDVFLDDKDTVAYVEGQLRKAASVALQKGSAIAIGHPRKHTYEALRAAFPELQREGITFVFARSLTTKP